MTLWEPLGAEKCYRYFMRKFIEIDKCREEWGRVRVGVTTCSDNTCMIFFCTGGSSSSSSIMLTECKIITSTKDDMAKPKASYHYYALVAGCGIVAAGAREFIRSRENCKLKREQRDRNSQQPWIKRDPDVNSSLLWGCFACQHYLLWLTTFFFGVRLMFHQVRLCSYAA